MNDVSNIDEASIRRAGLYIQRDFQAQELAERRHAVMKHIQGGVALLAGIPGVLGFDPIRQTNDFWYLAGVDVMGAYLLLDADKGVSTLYLKPYDARYEKADGPTLCADDGDFIRQHTGIDDVKPIAALMDDLKQVTRFHVLRDAAEGQRQPYDALRYFQKCVDADPLNQRPSPEQQLMNRLAQHCPQAEFLNLTPILQKLRLHKSAGEIEVMRKSSTLTALATIEAIKCVRPGILESQLAAVMDYVFQMNGAMPGGGYRPIIATGDNIWMMHYWRNNTALQPGGWVLIDYAPDYHYYTSDIGRMVPANGIYSLEQRELYGFVIEHHKTLIDLIKPGALPQDILTQAKDRMMPVVEKTKWTKAIYRDGAIKLLDSKRPLSHGVGMAVHEAAGYFDEPLKPGNVFTVDPELVIPEERLYIRCEDTVVVTESGVENLTGVCPLDMDQIETLMQTPGLTRVFQYPAI